jgi:hypothetical protein
MGLRAHVWAAFAVCVPAFGLGLGAGCLLELRHELSCGDGRVDVLAGEHCDPRAPDSPHLTECLDRGLGEGEAQCTDECKLEVSKDICAACGDGIAAGQEDCDGNDLRGQICPSAKGALSCAADCRFDASGCDLCGDEIVQSPPEECDVQRCSTNEDCGGDTICEEKTKTCIVPGDITFGTDCAELEVTGSLGKNSYTSGSVHNNDCGTLCLFDRRPCNFCGDGEVDPSYEDQGLNGGFNQVAEVCDGSEANQAALKTYCEDLCTDGNGTTLELRCDFVCDIDCADFKDPEWEDPVVESARCCVVGAQPCDVPSGFPCCWELDYPEEDPKDACVEFLEGNQIIRRCNTKPPDMGDASGD